MSLFYANVHVSIDIMLLADALAVYDDDDDDVVDTNGCAFSISYSSVEICVFACDFIQRVLCFFFWKSHCHSNPLTSAREHTSKP